MYTVTHTRQPRTEKAVLTVSGVKVPWSSNLHPRAAEYVDASRCRAQYYGLIGEDPLDTDVLSFMAFVTLDTRVYATVPFERLLVVGWFDQWLFFLDDLYDERPELGQDTQRVEALMQRQIDVLCAGATPSAQNPLECFTYDLGQALRGLTSARDWPLFVEGVEDYLFRGSLRSMIFWRERVVPDPETYVDIRTRDSAVMACFRLFQAAAGIQLPAAVLRNPVVMELSRYAILHISFLNDLFSYHKEVVVRGYPFNLLHVLMVHEGVSFGEAALRVIEQLNLYAERFVELERDLLPLCEQVEGLAKYIEVIKSWIAGNLEFSRRSGRYRHPTSPFVELRR